MKPMAVVAALALALAPLAPRAQDAEDKAIEHYREMISDPMSNPGFLAVDRGERIWGFPRGARNVSLEGCDLGEGPGELVRAYARLPRYFADADEVMDLEQRLLWCMRSLQGLDTADVVARHFGRPGVESDMQDLVAFVANKSAGLPIEPQLQHPREREAAAVGQALFFRRAGSMDFACATCHGSAGRRIRLQILPDLSRPGKDAQATISGWPAYRVSQSQTRSMQHRLWDCWRQQRWPEPQYASAAVTALEIYLNQQAAGGALAVPSIKR